MQNSGDVRQRTPETEPSGAGRRRRVVLVHGLGRTPAAMWPLARRLAAADYDLRYWYYVAFARDLETMTRDLRRALTEWAADTEELHLIGHSLGGILIRAALADPLLPLPPGRVVLIATPNQGSDLLVRMPATLTRPLDKAIPALPHLRKGATWLANLPAPERETGVILCTRDDNVLAPATVAMKIWGAGQASDGTVEVENARLPGATDQLTIHRSHSFILNDRTCHDAITRFLDRGRF